MIGTAVHFVLGVAVVGGLLWFASLLARRWKPGAIAAGRRDALRVVERRPIAKGVSVVRLSVEDRDLLIGASSKGVELLCELPKTPAPQQGPSAPALSYSPDGRPMRPGFVDALSASLANRRRRP